MVKNMDTNEPVPTSEPVVQDELRARLRAVFDEQIPNYGSFNIAYAFGLAGSGGPCLIGFRNQPIELVVAPIDAHTLQASESAVSINLTNISAVGIYSADSVELEMTTGRTFRVTCPPYPTVLLEASSSGTERTPAVTLDQYGESVDFAEFINFFADAIEAGTAP
ncbi:hypothetical protein HMPREF3160_03005 [Arthrobacter sp. HMSC06H05]|nr:hypothetical protein HMPREF3160_03005 [Arthrobacter sp. HMSC06H05]